MKRVFLIAALLIGFLPIRAFALFSTDASGTYIGAGPSAAFMIQMVETSDGHVTGRYEQMVARPDGKIDEMDGAIAGATDGSTFAITIKPTGLLTETISASGTLAGQILHLTGSGGLTLNLRRADEAQFQTYVAALRERGRQIMDARIKQETAEREAKFKVEFFDHIRDLKRRIETFSSAADADLKVLVSYEQRFRTITARMRSALDREEAILGNGQASLARGRIALSMGQASMTANNDHMIFASEFQRFQTAYKSLQRDSVDTSQTCHRAGTRTVANKEYDSLCLALLNSANRFRERAAALQSAFERVEKTWQSEHSEQASLLQASQSAVR